MGASVPQATTAVKRAGGLSRWLSAFAAGAMPEAPLDPTILAQWPTGVGEIPAPASVWAERPPLPSLFRWTTWPAETAGIVGWFRLP